MISSIARLRAWFTCQLPARLCAAITCVTLALAIGLPAGAQQPAQPSPTPDAAQQPASQVPSTGQAPAANPAPDANQQPAQQPAQQAPAETQPAAPAAETPPAAPAAAPAESQSATAPQNAPANAAPSAKPAKSEKQSSENPQAGGITEDELKQLLVGKSLYLRGGYLDNTLSFDEHGRIIGHSPAGSYTLSGIEIDKVHLTKHKVELEGVRYGLHFLGALPYEDPTKAVDRVRITPKKKFVKLTIDRELVVTPKKKKEKEQKQQKSKAGAPPSPVAGASPASAGAATTASAPPTPPAKAAPAAATEPSDEEQAKAEMAAAPQEERPSDPGSVTTTISPAHATATLKDALDHIFAPGLDDRIMAAMPDFWKLYYQAVEARTDYRPKDPSVLRQGAVDQKAKLISTFEPESNDFAQEAGVAGMALYHTVIGPDGRPGEIAVARPIGFGLDENAVAAIRKATFQPAIKDGQPVPVLLDLVVQFRIYSKRTAVAAKPETAEKPAETILPGPYSVKHQ
jgi:TonB family protein